MALQKQINFNVFLNISSRQKKESASHPTLAPVRGPQGFGVLLWQFWTKVLMVKLTPRNKSKINPRVLNHEESDGVHHFVPAARQIGRQDQLWGHFWDIFVRFFVKFDQEAPKWIQMNSKSFQINLKLILKPWEITIFRNLKIQKFSILTPKSTSDDRKSIRAPRASGTPNESAEVWDVLWRYMVRSTFLHLPLRGSLRAILGGPLVTLFFRL